MLNRVKFPEAWFPYQFDILGASHQIFHVLVLVAGLLHYKGLASALLEVRGLQHTCGVVSM
jgi:adiponectin receptor